MSFGPGPVPTYPISAFSRLPHGIAEELWKLVGPTVDRNINLPLWAQFVVVYYEGLNHGSGAERERATEAAANVVTEAGIYW